MIDNLLLKIMNSAIDASKIASEIIIRDFRRNLQNAYVGNIENKVSTHGLPDYVTLTDKTAEKAIIQELQQQFPTIPFVGEESGGKMDESDRFFLVDPLDGTSNFISLCEYFSVCVAYVEDREVKAAAIANPSTGAVVSAYKDGGAYINGEKISVSRETDLKKIQLSCEFPMMAACEAQVLSKVLPSVSGFRKFGSTALDIFYHAQGRPTAILSSCLSPYDVAAGILIARESGSVVTDLKGNPATIESKEILCAAPMPHKNIMTLIHS